MNKTKTRQRGERLEGVPGRYWHKLGDGRIQCDLCPRFCKLREGQRGLCFVRGRQGNKIVLTTYGRSSGFCVDPIEKKPLNHFLPGTPVLSFGQLKSPRVLRGLGRQPRSAVAAGHYADHHHPYRARAFELLANFSQAVPPRHLVLAGC